MTTDYKSLADVQPGGRVTLGDQAERARFESWATAQGLDPSVRLMLTSHPPQDGGYADNWLQRLWQAWQAALSAQPSPGGQDALDCIGRIEEAIEFRVPYDIYAAVHGELAELKAALAARQPVEEPVDVRANSMYGANIHTIERFVEAARELRERAEPYLEEINDADAGKERDECSLHFDRMMISVEIALRNIQPTYFDCMEVERASFELYRVHHLERDEQGWYENTVTADDWAMWQAACRHVRNRGK